MRSLKELYGMVYEHIKDLTYISGLCMRSRRHMTKLSCQMKNMSCYVIISNLNGIFIQSSKLKNVIGTDSNFQLLVDL